MSTVPAPPAASRLYAAFAAHDAPGLLAALSPDFRGVVADGMPLDLGGVYDGPEAMLTQVWGAVVPYLDVTPVPEEYLDAGGGRVVVVGRYRGTARATGTELDAVFAHLLRIRDDRVAELVQITDTARWQAALAPAPVPVRER